MQSWIFSGYFNDYRDALQINQSFGDQLLTLVKQEYLSIKDQLVFDCVTQVLKRALNQRTNLEVEFLKKAFYEVSFFTSVEREMNSFFVSKLLKHLQYEFIEARTQIFKAGDKGQDMYIILKGAVWEMNERLNINEDDPNMTPIEAEVLKMLPEENFLEHCYPTHTIYNTKKSGDYFGEISLRHGHPREFTTVTKEDTHFATISRGNFNDCVAIYFQKTRDDFLYFFTTFTIFQEWKKNEIEVAMLNCDNSFYKKDTLIYKEEDKDQNLYFIYSGEVEISHCCDIYDRDPNQLYNRREDIIKQKEELFNSQEYTSQNKNMKINKIVSKFLLQHQSDVKEGHLLDIKNEQILKKEELQKEVSQKQRQGIKLLWQTVRIPISILGKGESFGEEELFQQKNRCTQARVISAEAQILVMPLQEFKKMMQKRKKNYEEYTEYYIRNIIYNKVLNRQQQLAGSLKIKQLYLQYEHHNFVNHTTTSTSKNLTKKKIKVTRPVSAALPNMSKRKSFINNQHQKEEKQFSNTGNGFFMTSSSSKSIQKLGVKQDKSSILQRKEIILDEQIVINLPNTIENDVYLSNLNSEQVRSQSANAKTKYRNRFLTTNNSRESSIEKKQSFPTNAIQIIDQNSQKTDDTNMKQPLIRNRGNLASFNFFYNKAVTKTNSKHNLTLSGSLDKIVCKRSQNNTPKQKNADQPLNRIQKVRNVHQSGQNENGYCQQSDKLISERKSSIGRDSFRQHTQTQTQRSSTAQSTNRSLLVSKMRTPLNVTLRKQMKDKTQHLQMRDNKGNVDVFDDNQLEVKQVFYNPELLSAMEDNRTNVSVQNPIIDIQESLLQERQRKLMDRQFIQDKYRFIPRQLDEKSCNIRTSQIQRICLENNLNKRIPLNAAKFYLKKDEKDKYYNSFSAYNSNKNSRNNMDLINQNHKSNKIQQNASLTQKQNEQYKNMINNFVKNNKRSVQDEIHLIKNCIIQYNVDTRVPLPTKVSK